MRYAALFSFFLLLVSCSSELPAEHLSELGFYSTPEKVIVALEGKAGGPAGHFVLGHAYRETKEHRKAVINFANACFRFHRDLNIKHYPLPVYRFVTGFHIKSKFYPDAVYELARLYSTYTEHEYVVKFADLVPDDGSALYRDAMLLKAQSLVSLKRGNDALHCLRGLLKDYSDTGSVSLVRIRIASLLEQDGKTDEALREYGEAVYPDPDSWQAILAARKAAELMKNSGVTFTGNQKLSLAEALYHGRKFDDALGILDSMAAGGDKEAALLVKCLARKNDAARLAAVLAAKGSSPALLKVYADELWSMGRKDLAVQQYEILSSSGAEPVAKDSLERLARYQEDRKLAGFDAVLLKFTEKYPGDEKSADMLWLLGRYRLRQNNKEEARKYLSLSLEKFPDSNTSGHCRFWLYKILAEQGDTEGAMKVAADLASHNPDSSYAWRLFDRMAADFSKEDLADRFDRALDEDNDAAAMLYHTLLFIKEKDMAKRSARIARLGHPLADKYRSYAKAFSSLIVSSAVSNKMKALEKYFETGHLAGISREVQAVSNDKGQRKDLYGAFAYYGAKFKYYHYMVYGAVELLKLHELKENILLFPEDAVEAFLPRPFEKCVKESGGRFNVDKNLIYAVMKAESFFNHTAVSSAGAVGLMQLMPATARGIAKDLGMGNDFSLKDPCTSVLFGTQYVSWLKDYLQGQFEYMVAGYNGGAGNVKKWKRELDAPDMDYFTEFVPFDETRFYILRTGKFMAQYSSVYGD